MKYLLLMIVAVVSQGCAILGHETIVRDEQAALNIHCVEVPNKFTQMIGFGFVALDTHDIPTWETPKGHDERTQPYRLGKPGCNIGKFTSVQDPNAEEDITCFESCNAYTKKHGFAALKYDTMPQFARQALAGPHYRKIPLKVSRDASHDTVETP